GRPTRSGDWSSDVCSSDLEVFYDDRLEPEAHLVRQRLSVPIAIVDGVGPRLLTLPSEGADNESPIEADAIASLATSLVRDGSWTHAEGGANPRTWKDVAIVAPSNTRRS